MIDFYKMSEKEIILLSAAVAVILVEGLTVDEQNTLGNFIMCVGQNIASGAAQKGINDELNKPEKGNVPGV